MYQTSKFSLLLAFVLTFFCAGLTYQGFGNNLETYIQAGATVFLATMFYVRLGWYQRAKEYNNQRDEDIPTVVTREMNDPFSQTIWQAFDSGKVVLHNSGDGHMTTVDVEGNEVKVKLKK